MGFAEDIAKLSEQVRKRVDNVSGEEAVKMALIVPFLSALGYDVYDPDFSFKTLLYPPYFP
jgi:hypothetical protein